MSKFFSETLALARKDFLSLFRAPGGLTSCFILALMLAVVASFAVAYAGMSQAARVSVGGGLVWMVFLFSAVVFINQLTVIEREDRAINSLLLSAATRESIFLSKFIVCFSSLFFVSLFSLALLALFFGFQVTDFILPLSLVCILGASGLSSIGILLSMISVQSEARDILFPILLFPLSLPLLAGCVSLSRDILAGGGAQAGDFWMVCICVYDVIAFTAGLVLFEHTVWD